MNRDYTNNAWQRFARGRLEGLGLCAGPETRDRVHVGRKYSPPFLRSRRVGSIAAQNLLQNDRSELTCQIIAGTGSKEQRVARTIGRRIAAEINGPELIDVDGLSRRVSHGAHKRAGLRIEGINRTFICVV